MAHLHKKNKGGRVYYYIRESTSVGGKTVITNQVYLGTLEKILEMATTATEAGVQKVQAQEFGALWLANLIEKEVGVVGIIDSVVGTRARPSGPSVGEYFLYAAFNRMVDAKSKRALPDWFKASAIQSIRPVEIKALNSDRFCKTWGKVSQQQVQEIASKLFSRLAELEPAKSDCFLFDTTNYYTYMASQTESELANRGKSKEGKNWLRQIGLALLVSRDNGMPRFYREFEGNCHDSKLFSRILDQVLAVMTKNELTGGDVTVVFDKGMNSVENISAIDATKQAHFITTYSTYLGERYIHIDRSRFSPVHTPRNAQLERAGREEDMLVAFRTTGEYWGKERTVVVTYNPLTATKQRVRFEKQLLKLQTALYEMRKKVRDKEKQWRDQKKVQVRIAAVCEALFLPSDLYDISFEQAAGRLQMSFRKNFYRISRYIDRFGKNIIITDHTNWSTEAVINACLDRNMVEQSFRQSKHDDLVNLVPIRHWTDSKIRCHILACIIALCYLRLIELRLTRAGLKMTAVTAMEHMHRLHSCLVWHGRKREPARMIEEPSEMQAKILKAFGYKIDNGVLLLAA
jgi:transposase